MHTATRAEPFGHTRLQRLCRIGYWASSIAVLVAATAIGVMLYWTATANEVFNIDLIKQLEIEDYVDIMSPAQLWLASFLWLAVDWLGLLMLLNVRALFAELLHGGIFAHIIALRLRRIGLIILAMAPVSIVSETLAGVLVSAWHTGNQARGAIGIEDTDVYAIVIGLVITAVSHIMIEAAKLSEENQAFV